MLEQLQLPPYWAIVKWTGIRGFDKDRIRMSVQQFKDSLYFMYDKKIAFYTQAYTITDQHGLRGTHYLLTRDEDWVSRAWIMDDEVFNTLLDDIVVQKPHRMWLETYFLAMVDKWKITFGVPVLEEHGALRFLVWQDVVDWLTEVRETIKRSWKTSYYSKEIVRDIMKSLDYIQQEFQKELSILDAAKHASMSRSYFSRCFHDITGHTFNEYLRLLRIGHAKQLLKQSSKPIRWVAFQSGYPNEKYFCKVFRKEVGLQPREYRLTSRENAGN
ncbi:hypothetical protein CGZ75_19905 [Paenibacillus herberti]|uniref:HTH araC/xylS-type domain-containing protein n=2 Tax=Paenibacillus herberti TaxID=1619309 RepID=A0A229NUF1_9BACL|nr:hypothetical protein CGZ75_19905 [Paenibacillus herberti]